MSPQRAGMFERSGKEKLGSVLDMPPFAPATRHRYRRHCLFVKSRTIFRQTGPITADAGRLRTIPLIGFTNVGVTDFGREFSSKKYGHSRDSRKGPSPPKTEKYPHLLAEGLDYILNFGFQAQKIGHLRDSQRVASATGGEAGIRRWQFWLTSYFSTNSAYFVAIFNVKLGQVRSS
jgi:hypothetical protein